MAVAAWTVEFNLKILSFEIENYRTLEKAVLRFPSSYAALCGANDSGKTNVVRALRTLTKGEATHAFLSGYDSDDLSIKQDFPKWKDTPVAEKRITLTLTVEVEQDRDAGFYQFLRKQLSIEQTPAALTLVLALAHGPERKEQSLRVECAGVVHDGLEAQEVLQRLQTARAILFYNSTQLDPRFPFPSAADGVFRASSAEHEALVANMKRQVTKGLSKISKTHQKELESLLGRLETKYKIGLATPVFDFSSVPFDVTLGQNNIQVPLDDWGAGTRNRTLILMALFRAKQLSQSDVSAAKMTPVLVVEEPESFLHPAAQAEFGRVLQDIAEEFKVQVIVTTHSPYLLSINNPESNILLRRRLKNRALEGTECIETSGDNWMEPFSLALGLQSQEFKPWKSLILADSDAILLVEGETDKAYFELLQDPAHGEKRLRFDGKILCYDGVGTLQNTVLLRFLKDRHQKMFITYDLDSEAQVQKQLETLGFERKKHFMPVGQEGAGKQDIEGLLPEVVLKSVYSSNTALVQEIANGKKPERDAARRKIKKLLLEEFKKVAVPGTDSYAGFYPLVRVINGALDR